MLAISPSGPPVGMEICYDSILDALPEEVLFSIFAYLSEAKDVVSLTLVCNRFHKICNDAQLYPLSKFITAIRPLLQLPAQSCDPVYTSNGTYQSTIAFDRKTLKICTKENANIATLHIFIQYANSQNIMQLFDMPQISVLKIQGNVEKLAAVVQSTLRTMASKAIDYAKEHPQEGFEDCEQLAWLTILCTPAINLSSQ